MEKRRHTYPENGDEENLILGQQQTDESMRFDDESRPDPSVTDDLSNRETPFKKVDFPNTPEGQGYSNYEELLASEEYKNALNKLEEFTGERNIGVGTEGKYFQLSMNAMRLFKKILMIENNHADELSELCERIIRDHFKIPEDRLLFDFRLTKQGIKVTKNPSKQELQQKEEELADDINELTPERAKRRLINAMTQGHSVDQSYLFNVVEQELVNITGEQNIIELYSAFVAIMMLGYWQFSPEQMSSAQGEGQDAAGKARIDTSTRPPTIHAESIIFPFLIHEAIKGVMEYLGKERNPEDPEKSKKAMDLEDQLIHETWDIRLGPAIWRRLIKLFPNAIVEQEDQKKLQYYIYSNIANLPVREFLILMKEVIEGTTDGRQLIGAMYYDLTMVLDDEEVTEENSNFRNKMNEVLARYPEENDDDLHDFLADLGIRVN